MREQITLNEMMMMSALC